MMDMLSDIVDFHHPLWQVVGFIILPLVAVVVAWSPLRKIFRHWQLQKLIQRLGAAHIRQSRIALGEDEIYAEHLVLRPDGITLLMVRPYRGNIFAAEKIDMWTQVLGHHSFKFPNPLYELERDVQTLRGMLRDIPVRGRVIFGQGARFPKGKPEQVYDFASLREAAGENVGAEIGDKLHAAWAEVQACAAPSAHLQSAILYQRGDKRRLAVGALFVLLALAYVAWRFGWFAVRG